MPPLPKSAWGWRTVFVVGTVPPVMMLVQVVSLRETERFTAARPAGRRPSKETSLLRTFRGLPPRPAPSLPPRAWADVHLHVQPARLLQGNTPLRERGMTDAQVGGYGDHRGDWLDPADSVVFRSAARSLCRRTGAVIIFGLTAISDGDDLSATSRGAITAALTIGIFGISAVLLVLNAFTTELFRPTCAATHRLGQYADWADVTQVLSP